MEEFKAMGWVLNRLGPQAIIYPGQCQHARGAIQWLSGRIKPERHFAYLGWRKHALQWVYLQGAGAMGSQRLLSGVRVELPAAFAALPTIAVETSLRPGERGSAQSGFSVAGT